MNKELQDLVWSILPKEFKEEVKRMWSVEVDCATKYKSELHKHRTGLLYELFGEHLHWQNNLTSDAEGEEMLTVSRKKVQRRYHMAYKCKHSGLLSHDDVQFWKGWQSALDDLFGSKCLPDNIDSSEPNVDSSHGSVDSLEPKPAEPKVKVGDYVRYKGDVHRVVATTKDNRCYLNKILGSIDESDLEPYTEPKETKAEEVADKAIKPVAEQFDNILRKSLSKERRLTIAAQMMQGLICAPLIPGVDPNPPAEYLAQMAFRLADALIAEAEKGGAQ